MWANAVAYLENGEGRFHAQLYKDVANPQATVYFCVCESNSGCEDENKCKCKVN